MNPKMTSSNSRFRVFTLFLAILWTALACGLYVLMNSPWLPAEQRERTELGFWFAVLLAAFNWGRILLSTWLKSQRRRREIQTRLEDPKGPVVHPEFRVDDADDRITRRDAE
jgi:hypothetical protein